MRARGLLRIIEGGQVGFWCPGCDCMHAIDVNPGGWGFNGNYDKPTFTPSVMVTSGHFAKDWPERKAKGLDCWCSFAQKHPGVTTFKCFLCHSFVKDGQIQFLTDSTHPLAGKTVALEIPNV